MGLFVRSWRAVVVLLLALTGVTSVLSGCSSNGGDDVELVAPPVVYVSRDPHRTAHDLQVQERALDGKTVELRVTFDAADLKDVVTVRRALDDCVVHLPVYHCDTQVGAGPGGIQAFHLSPAKGAKAGDSGVLRYRVTAPGMRPLTGKTRVVVGRPELRVATRLRQGPVQPGESLAVRLSVRNVGDVPARGVALSMEAHDGVTIGSRHTNCYYRGSTSVWCRLAAADVVIPPGRSYSLAVPEHLRAARDAGYPTVDVSAAAVGTEYVPPVASWHRPDDGTRLRLVPATVTDPAVPDKAGDGPQVLHVPVRNRSELAAIADTARGPVGSLATVRIGVRNDGPGSLPTTVRVVFTVPEGTTVVESPYSFAGDEEAIDQDCRAVAADDTPLAEAFVKQPSARRYVCTARVEAVGATTTFSFTLRIDTGTDSVDRRGRVTVSDGDSARPSRDTTPTDDAADVVVSVWPGPAWATPGFYVGAAVVIALLAAALALYTRRRRPASSAE
ncbi:hypothetical protein ACWCPD_20675 [Streptomyces sp. NPDC001935]